MNYRKEKRWYTQLLSMKLTSSTVERKGSSLYFQVRLCACTCACACACVACVCLCFVFDICVLDVCVCLFTAITTAILVYLDIKTFSWIYLPKAYVLEPFHDTLLLIFIMFSFIR